MREIETADLLDDGSISKGVHDRFSPSYGKLLAAAFATSSDALTKALKGGDQVMLAHLQQLVQTAVPVAIHAFVALDLVPFMSTLVSGAKSNSLPEPQALLDTMSCINCVKDTVAASTVRELCDFSVHVSTMIKDLRAASAGELSADESQTSLQKWQQVSGRVLSHLKSCKDLPQFTAKLCGLLKEPISQLTDAVTGVLQGRVDREAGGHVGSCITMARKAAAHTELSAEDMTNFNKCLEQANLMTSVMGQQGKHIRDGLAVLKVAVLSEHTLQPSRTPTGTSDDVNDRELAAVARCQKLERAGLASAEASIDRMLDIMKGTIAMEPAEVVAAIMSHIKELVHETTAILDQLRKGWSHEASEAKEVVKSLELPDQITSLT